MKMTEIIALAKAGYKKSDIDALLAVDIDEISEDGTEANLTDEESADTTVERTDGKAEQKKAEEHSEQKEEPDYKALYEKACADLKLAQEANLTQNIKKEDDSPSINDILDSFII